MDKEQLKLIVGRLVTVLEVAAPQVAVPVESLILLFQAGTELNGLLKQVREETPDTADAVLAAVIEDYTKSSLGWDALAAKEKSNEG